jgi:hypothetical protein
MTTLAIAIDAMAAQEGARKIVSATDSISAGAGKATNAFKVMGLSLDKLLALAGASFSFKYMVGQAMDAEKAQLDLAAALDIVGANTSSNMSILKAYATEMQSISRFEDDAILSQMAYAKNLGVQTTDLKTVTEAAIEMAVAYRKDLPSAMELTARAYQGHTEMLQRMGITLDKTKSKEEQWIELKDLLHGKFDLIQKDAESSIGSYERLKIAIGNTAEAIATAWLPSITEMNKSITDWLTGHEADFVYWSGMATASIQLVGSIGLDFVQFMGTDWKTGIKFGLDSSIVLFTAWGESMYVVVQDAFLNITGSIGDWTKKAAVMAIDKAGIQEKIYSELWNKEYGGMGGFISNPLRPQGTNEAMLSEAKRRASEEVARQNSLGVYDVMVGHTDTVPVSATANKLLQIATDAAAKLKAVAPPGLLTDISNKTEIYTNKVADLTAAHDAANLAIERTVQLQQFLVELYSNSSMGFEEFANAWDAINNAAIPKDLTAGTDENKYNRNWEEEAEALKKKADAETKATASMDEMSNALKLEKSLIGMLDDERERAIELSKYQTLADIAYGKQTEKNIEAVEGYKNSLLELSQAKAKYALDEMNRESMVERKLIGMPKADQVIASKMAEYEKQAQLAYGKDTDAYKKAIQARQEYERTNYELTKLRETTDSIGGAAGSAFEDFVFGAKTAKQAIADLSMEIAHLVFQYAVTRPIAEAIGVGLFGGTSWLAGSAMGNVFDGGRITAFANGGIVSRPTLFPMASGAGLMGENGPEAVMPLSRGRDGRLGVSSAGGGVAVQNQVNVYNNSGQPIDAKATETRFDGKGYITDIFITDLNTNGPIARSMKQLQNRGY